MMLVMRLDLLLIFGFGRPDPSSRLGFGYSVLGRLNDPIPWGSSINVQPQSPPVAVREDILWGIISCVSVSHDAFKVAHWPPD